MLRTHTYWSDRTAVVVVEGELDMSTTLLLQDGIDGALAAGAADLVIDLRRLEFMDSTGIHLLVAVAERSRREGLGLAIVGAGGPVLRALRTTGIDAVLPLV